MSGSVMRRWMYFAAMLIVGVAIWSRISRMKEGPALVSNAATALSNLFRGVLR